MAKATGKKATGEATGTAGKLKAAAAKVAKSVAGTTGAAAPAKPASRSRAKAAPAAGTPQVVMTVTHDDIARKAYEIWLAKGCPSGRDEENWREAESLLAGGGRR